MNDPKNMPIDIGEMHAWLKEYQLRSHKSWSAISRESGIGKGTISTFMSLWPKGDYPGNAQNMAERVFQYRQKVDNQEKHASAVLERPDFVATPTSNRVLGLCQLSAMGRIVAVATGPGTGKTYSLEHFRSAFGDTCWMITLRESTKTPAAMLMEVMRQMGLHGRRGWTQQCSSEIIEYVRHKKGVLIVDEANHALLPTLEELRAIHDATELGIVLAGNEELHTRIHGGTNRHAYARLMSRISGWLLQDLPEERDVEMYLDHLDIIEPDMRRPLIEVGISPGHGGLREVQQIIQQAQLIAIGEDEVISADYIKRARRMRSMKVLRGMAA
ncbi:MAG: hypothetical protein CVT77_06460 [Alphaproteobacteria bacterium HGW-Alphaproteobacteria-16]|nr:MAG: hypothetical protein CVT77_06460 [Alphaproteobacteria bacterium HGW-Alphaproteobacteria-16]